MTTKHHLSATSELANMLREWQRNGVMVSRLRSPLIEALANAEIVDLPEFNCKRCKKIISQDNIQQGYINFCMGCVIDGIKGE